MAESTVSERPVTRKGPNPGTTTKDVEKMLSGNLPASPIDVEQLQEQIERLEMANAELQLQVKRLGPLAARTENAEMKLNAKIKTSMPGWKPCVNHTNPDTNEVGLAISLGNSNRGFYPVLYRMYRYEIDEKTGVMKIGDATSEPLQLVPSQLNDEGDGWWRLSPATTA